MELDPIDVCAELTALRLLLLPVYADVLRASPEGFSAVMQQLQALATKPMQFRDPADKHFSDEMAVRVTVTLQRFEQRVRASGAIPSADT